MHSIESRFCIGQSKYTVFRCVWVRALFSSEILQAGAVKGLISLMVSVDVSQQTLKQVVPLRMWPLLDHVKYHW